MFGLEGNSRLRNKSTSCTVLYNVCVMRNLYLLLITYQQEAADMIREIV